MATWQDYEMGQQPLQFRRWDHAIAALFFAALFTVSLLSEISAGAWERVGPPLVATVMSMIIFARRPGVIMRPTQLVVFSDWYDKKTYDYAAIDRVEVNEASWANPVQLILVDGTKRNLPMLGLGRRPNEYERKMLDALKDVIPVTWNKTGS